MRRQKVVTCTQYVPLKPAGVTLRPCGVKQLICISAVSPRGGRSGFSAPRRADTRVGPEWPGTNKPLPSQAQAEEPSGREMRRECSLSEITPEKASWRRRRCVCFLQATMSLTVKPSSNSDGLFLLLLFPPFAEWMSCSCPPPSGEMEVQTILLSNSSCIKIH